jgi:hypothetical protein
VAFWGWRVGIISYFSLVEVLFLLSEAIFWQWPWLGARGSSTSWVGSHLGKVCKLGGWIPRGCWWVSAGGGRGESIGADSRLVVLGPRGSHGKRPFRRNSQFSLLTLRSVNHQRQPSHLSPTRSGLPHAQSISKTSHHQIATLGLDSATVM